MTNIYLNRNFILMWLGMTVSGIGTWVDFVGMNLYVYNIFGSGKILGIFMMARMVPSIFFGSLGGYLADRYSRKAIMIICDSCRALLVLGFIFTKDLFLFFILGITLSALDKIYVAANTSFLPNIVKKEDLIKANSFIRMSLSLITILGSAAGGILISNLNIQWVFIIDSITFIFSVISVLLITNYSPQKEGQRKKSGILEDFKTAFKFFKNQPSLIFIAGIRLVDSFGSGSYNTTLPVYSKTLNLSRGAAYGWLVGVWSLGEFTGSIAVNYFSRRINISTEKLFGISVLIMAIGMGMTFHFNSIWPALISIFFGGLCDGISNILFFTVMMKETPDEVRGKVLGTLTSTVYTTLAIGMAVAGVFLDSYSIHFTTDISTLIIIVGVIAGYFLYVVKYNRQIDNL